MSKTIDERVVMMEFDNKQFESNMAQSQKTLENFEKQLQFKDAGKGFSEINTAASKIDFDKLNTAIDTINSRFSNFGIAATTVLTNLVNSVTNAAKQITNQFVLRPIMDGLGEYQTQMDSIASLKLATGKGTSDVLSWLDDLNAYADETVYNFTQMTDNFSKMVTAGVDAEDALDVIKGYMNLAAGHNVSNARAQGGLTQLIQGLQAGFIQLQDWRSLENAGMAGETEQEKIKEVAREAGINVDALIDKWGSFRESLTREKWLTTDIVVEAFSRFNDESDELGAKYKAAASNINTLSKMTDELGERVGSSWALTWRYIIGNIDEAADLFNYLGKDVFGPILDAMNKPRNDLLESWSKMGGRAKALEALKEICSALLKVIDELTKAFGDVIPKMTAKDLMSMVDAFKNIMLAVIPTGKTLDRLKTVFQGIVASAKLLFDIFAPIVTALFKLAGGIAKFGADAVLYFLQPVAKIIVALEKWVAATAPVEKAIHLISTTIEQVGMTLKTIGTVISNVANTINKAIYEATGVDIFGTIQGWIDSIKAFFGVLTNGENNDDALKAPFENAEEAVKNFFSSIRDYFASTSFMHPLIDTITNGTNAFINFIEAVKNSNIGTFFKMAADSISNFVSMIFDKFSELSSANTDEAFGFVDETKNKVSILDTIGKVLIDIWTGIINIWQTISPLLKAAWDALGGALSQFSGQVQSAFSNIDWGNALQEIIKGGLGGFLLSVIWKIVDAFKNLTSVGEGLNGILEALGGWIDALSTTMKWEAAAGMIKEIGNALIKMVIAIVVLTLIDADKARTGILLVGALLLELGGALKMITDGLPGDIAKSIVACAAVIGSLSTSVIKLTAALFVLTLLDQGKALAGIGLLGAMMGEVTGAILAITKWGDPLEVAKGSTMMLPKLISSIANGILKMSIALALLTALDPDKLGNAVLSITVMIGEFSAAVIGITRLSGSMAKEAVVVNLISAMSNAFIKMSIALLLISGLNWQQLLQSCIALGAMIGIMSAVIIGLSKLPLGKIDSLGPTMIMLSGAILIMAVAVLAMSVPTIFMGIGALTAITKLIKSMAKLNSDSVTAAAGIVIFAAAIAIISASLLAFIFIPIENLAMGTIAIIALVGVFAMISEYINPEKIIAVAAAFVLFGAAVLEISVALMFLQNFSFEESWQGLLALVAVMALFIGMMYALSPIGGIVLAIGAAFALFGAGILMTAMSLSILTVTLPAFAAALVLATPSLLLAAEMMLVGLTRIFTRMLAEASKALPSVIKSLIELLSGLIIGMVEPIVQATIKLLTLLADAAPEISRLLGEIVFGIIWGITEAAANWIQPIVDETFRFFINFISAVNKNLKIYKTKIADEVSSLFINILDLVKETVKDLFWKLWDWGEELGEEIAKGLGDIGPKFQEAGEELLQNLINGIGNMAESAKNSVVQFGSNCLNWLKDTFGISSPSKETAEIGGYFVEGFNKGLDKNVDSSISQVKELGGDLIDNFKESFNLDEVFGTEDTKFDMSIAPVLDTTNFDSGIANMSSTLSNFKVDSDPNFSIGSFDQVQTINVNSDNSDILKSLNNIDGNLTNLNTNMSNMQVTLDGETLVGEMAPAMNTELGKMTTLQMRGV